MPQPRFSATGERPTATGTQGNPQVPQIYRAPIYIFTLSSPMGLGQGTQKKNKGAADLDRLPHRY